MSFQNYFNYSFAKFRIQCFMNIKWHIFGKVYLPLFFSITLMLIYTYIIKLMILSNLKDFNNYSLFIKVIKIIKLINKQWLESILNARMCHSQLCYKYIHYMIIINKK